mmetsp:Transcript_63814/g.125643  ORF Transcript_63814/g.125643 Transcript_63814/m.125643 type:complete len:217 (+) Transcript_63814:269-919(+)
MGRRSWEEGSVGCCWSQACSNASSVPKRPLVGLVRLSRMKSLHWLLARFNSNRSEFKGVFTMLPNMVLVSAPPKGSERQIKKYNVAPRPQTSDLKQQPCLRMISGAEKPGEPHGFITDSRSWTEQAMPKSTITTVLSVRSMRFEGLMSRCTNPNECMCFKPAKTSRTADFNIVSGCVFHLTLLKSPTQSSIVKQRGGAGTSTSGSFFEPGSNRKRP